MALSSNLQSEGAVASRPANLLMASNHDDCVRLKDLVSKEDATTMVVVMTKSVENDEGGKLHHKFMGPRLLMAVRNGDFVELEDLLKNQQLTPAELVIHVQEEGSDQSIDDEVEEGINDGHRQLAEEASEQQAAADADEQGAHCLLLSRVCFDSDGDSALHVAVTGGDSERHLKCAEIIYDKAKKLLEATNKNGDTPLHCAARAGNLKMVSRLIELVARENRGARRVKELLRTENKIGETALHEAIRNGNIEIMRKLISEDPELPGIPKDGASALYLAVSLRRRDIVEELFSERCRSLSFSGPDGRNVLHIGVFREEELELLLEPCNRSALPIMSLTRQVDKHGSTPLHFAASSEYDWSRKSLAWFVDSIMDLIGYPFWFLRHVTREGPTAWLIEADKFALCQPDKRGLYPIHVAAYSGCLKAVVVMLESFPAGATLRDGRGRTFLHVAVEKKSWDIIAFASQDPKCASVLNMQDENGNSALHLAVEAGNQWIFNCLFQNRQVRLDLANKHGLTAIELAWFKIPGRGIFYYGENPRYFILHALAIAQAPGSDCRLDHLHEKDTREIDEEKESAKLTNATQIMGIVSVLVATVTFAAAFTLPGGYRDDGTPNLAGSYAFNAFIISIALAFICSLLATGGLIYCGFPSVDYSIRGRYSDRSNYLLESSVRSLAVAFALAIYLEMAPVAYKTAIAVCIIIGVALLLQNFEIQQAIVLANTIRIRLGLRAAPLHPIFVKMGRKFWSLIIIFTLPAFWKIHHHTK